MITTFPSYWQEDLEGIPPESVKGLITERKVNTHSLVSTLFLQDYGHGEHKGQIKFTVCPPHSSHHGRVH